MQVSSTGVRQATAPTIGVRSTFGRVRRRRRNRSSTQPSPNASTGMLSPQSSAYVGQRAVGATR